ncbi:MAG: zf-HC2 domain-containing protein [Planctomycetota bacterium]|jgi:hypothetical protein
MHERIEEINCSELTNDLLADYWAGGLDSPLRAAIDAHIAECDSCRERFVEIRMLSTTLTEAAAEGKITAPKGSYAAIRGFKEDRQSGRIPVSKGRPISIARILLALAACLVVGVIAGWILTSTGLAPEMLKFEPAPEPMAAAPDTVSSELRMLKDNLELAKKENETLKKQVEESTGNIGTLNSRVQSLTEELGGERSRSNNLETALKKKDEETSASIAELRGEIERQKTEIAKLFEARDRDAEESRKKLAEADNRIIRYNADVEVVKARLALLENENKELKEAALVAGDFNHDGRADISDVMEITKQLLEGKKIDYSSEGDANGDGKIDIGDALLISNQSLSGGR